LEEGLEVEERECGLGPFQSMDVQEPVINDVRGWPLWGGEDGGSRSLGEINEKLNQVGGGRRVSVSWDWMERNREPRAKRVWEGPVKLRLAS
jgi:hypothetical protein